MHGTSLFYGLSNGPLGSIHAPEIYLAYGHEGMDMDRAASGVVVDDAMPLLMFLAVSSSTCPQRKKKGAGSVVDIND